MNVRHNRLRVRRKPAVSRFPLPPLLAVGMAAGYVIGCCFGANAALPEPSNPVLSFLSSSGAGGTLYGGLLPELCVSCAYGFAFLLLSTSYLGFLLIPAVFGIKGFLSACTAAAFLNSVCDHAFWLSCRSARHFSCAGAVSARNALRADVCASARAAARPASPRIIGAIFPGAGACVLPAVGGCGRRVLCSTVFHTAYSVTCGHCG